MTGSEKGSVTGSVIGSVTASEHIEIEGDTSADKILFLIKNDHYISAPKIANSLGLSTRAVEKQLRALRETRRIQRVGPDFGGHWKILKH